MITEIQLSALDDHQIGPVSDLNHSFPKRSLVQELLSPPKRQSIKGKIISASLHFLADQRMNLV